MEFGVEAAHAHEQFPSQQHEHRREGPRGQGHERAARDAGRAESEGERSAALRTAQGTQAAVRKQKSGPDVAPWIGLGAREMAEVEDRSQGSDQERDPRHFALIPAGTPVLVLAVEQGSAHEERAIGHEKAGRGTEACPYRPKQGAHIRCLHHVVGRCVQLANASWKAG